MQTPTVLPFASPAEMASTANTADAAYALDTAMAADAAAPAVDAMLARAWAVLEAVPDPEIPVVSIRELGILRDVRIATPSPAKQTDALADSVADRTDLEVVITPTYSGCPAMSQIAEDVERALSAAGFGHARIVTTLTPAWTTDWITPEAREKLRVYGIAPPGERPAGVQPVHFMRRRARHDAAQAEPSCPHCGSADTERLAQFGSTACKALYRCRTCREPFDYFKPY